ncbi:MAG: K(+)-transporting ATPase subunit F [Gammaproteobacteria bacterium]
MNWLYLLALLLAVGLFVYLCIALLWPERFT